MIGEEAMTVGGTAFSVVLANQDSGLDFSDGRNEPDKRLQAVMRADAMTPEIKENALATARGESWRIDRIDNRVGTFATVHLSTETRA